MPRNKKIDTSKLPQPEIETQHAEIVGSTHVHDDQPGFNQYTIEWTDDHNQVLHFGKPKCNDPRLAVRFRADAGGFLFYGNWRLTRWREDRDREGWAVDVWAQCKGKFYTIPVLEYPSYDPRLPGIIEEMSEDGDKPSFTKYSGIRELNADICVAINQWLHKHHANVETIEDLRFRAEHPTLRFDSFDAFRTALEKLIRLYEDSASSGGFRTAVLKGDHQGDPEVIFQTNLTTEVVDLEFKVPPPPRIPQGVVRVAAQEITTTQRSKVAAAELGGDDKTLRARLIEIQKVPKDRRTPELKREERKIRARRRQLKQSS